VGRETVPLKFDIKQLEKKLAALKDADLRKELRRFQIDKNTDDENPDFGFYEALKVEKEDIRLPAESVDKKKHPSPSKVKADKARQKRPDKPKQTAKSSGSVSRNTGTSEKKLTVQVASVKNVQDAGRLIVSLKKKGFAAYMNKAVIPGRGTWYRVRVGPYKNRTQADRTLSKLKKEKYNGIIITY
jgi:cell division septation protein DedD